MLRNRCPGARAASVTGRSQLFRGILTGKIACMYNALRYRVRVVRIALVLAYIASFIRCGVAGHDARPTDSARADSIARARQDSTNRAQPGYVVDSALPPAEELRRFRGAIGGAPATALTGGSTSREALARRLVNAVAKRDTADLRAMALSAREFADLVYPSSRYSRPPYRQAPGFMWAQLMRTSVTGFGRLMRDRGGVRYEYNGVLCRATPATEGANRVWTGCSLWLGRPGRDTVTEQWFDSIIERDGQFKIVSYANHF